MRNITFFWKGSREPFDALYKKNKVTNDVDQKQKFRGNPRIITKVDSLRGRNTIMM